jgi:monomeric isocitrate dehydrogenase
MAGRHHGAHRARGATDGTVTVLKDKLALQAGEILDAAP